MKAGGSSIIQKSRLLQLFHKIFFSIAIPVDVVWEFISKGSFQFSILFGNFMVRTQIVSHCKMSFYIGLVGNFKDMNLVGPFIAAFAQVPSARYTEFAPIFISDFSNSDATESTF